ncbi:MAG: hypothetical protein M5U17_01960 [Ignavibacterium sp.]|nr:hypothetical protein [Ignavibacterium sp.]
MENKLKYILGIIVALIVLAGVGYFVINKPASVSHSASNTITKTTEEIKTTQNNFTVEQVAVIKKALTDSLAKVYGSIINSLRSNDLAVNPSPAKGEGNKDSLFSYVSEVDSQFAVKDDSGSITDLLEVKSTFISPVPLTGNYAHLVKLDHTAFRKETKTDSRTYDTIYVYQSRGFWERFVISPNVSAGYGLINKKFDVYTGVGLSFEFNASELFYNKK